MTRPSTPREHFDKGYYDRYYRNRETRVLSARDVQRLASFVSAYLRYLRLPVRRVLDIGCGLGLWKRALEEHWGRASYTGVEISDYLCERYGWTQGSVVDFRAKTPFDLVICQGVLQYLSDADARAAIENLARLSRGALYLEALTEEDWEDNCDRERTDGRVRLRPVRWYRQRLARHFVNCGGGVFVSKQAPAVLYELEKV